MNDARLKDELKRLKEDNDELGELFDLQRTRMAKATKVWQDATGRHGIFPDLGDLLDWLLAEVKRLKAEQENEQREYHRVREAQRAFTKLFIEGNMKARLAAADEVCEAAIEHDAAIRERPPLTLEAANMMAKLDAWRQTREADDVCDT